jgi:hypothetical protein
MYSFKMCLFSCCHSRVVIPQILNCGQDLNLRMLKFMRNTLEISFNWMQIQGEDSAALMAVGVVHATCESVFATVMALGPSRAE